MRTTAAAARRARRLVVVLVTSIAAILASTLAYADGVDVSHWQGTINWSKVKAAGMQFAFMKATESTTYTDTQLATNWAGVQAVGMYRGAYHFARPKVGTAPAQAKYFVSKVGSFQGPGTLPPVLDLEASGGLGVTALRSWTATWLQTVEQLTGRTPIIYVSPAFWEYYLGNSTAFTRYPLWIAHYGVSTPRVPGGWPTWTFWQRTSSGTVSGISGNVDMNRFNGTSAQLAALANTTGGSTAPVPPGVTVPTGDPTAVSISASSTATTAINGPVTFAGDLRRTADSSCVGAYSSTQWVQFSRTRRWARIPMSVEVMRKWGTPRSRRRVMDDGASLVCRVESTRWPVSAAWTAFSAVSASRISPTMMMSGSWRRMWRSAAAKVIPTLFCTAVWLKVGFTISMGSSMVVMLTSGVASVFNAE